MPANHSITNVLSPNLTVWYTHLGAAAFGTTTLAWLPWWWPGDWIPMATAASSVSCVNRLLNLPTRSSDDRLREKSALPGCSLRPGIMSIYDFKQRKGWKVTVKFFFNFQIIPIFFIFFTYIFPAHVQVWCNHHRWYGKNDPICMSESVKTKLDIRYNHVLAVIGTKIPRVIPLNSKTSCD